MSNLDNVYITHGIVGYTHTIDLLCKSANVVRVPRGDRIKLSSIANRLIWLRLSGSSLLHGDGMEFLLSLTIGLIVRFPIIELASSKKVLNSSSRY